MRPHPLWKVERWEMLQVEKHLTTFPNKFGRRKWQTYQKKIEKQENEEKCLLKPFFTESHKTPKKLRQNAMIQHDLDDQPLGKVGETNEDLEKKKKWWWKKVHCDRWSWSSKPKNYREKEKIKKQRDLAKQTEWRRHQKTLESKKIRKNHKSI